MIQVADLIASDRFTELSRDAVIRRDTYGIPHIRAKTEEAASFALGYAQAEDHCPQIAQQFLAGRGEEAKIMGTGEESDLLMKLYENPTESTRDLRRLPQSFRKIVQSYAAGVNRYIEQHRAELPAWIQPVTGADVLANRRAGAIRSVFSRATIRALEKKYGAAPASGSREEAPELLAPAPDEAAQTDAESGSNALALSASKTVSEKPILLGNPHLNWNSLYWEAQITVPGRLNFFGSTLAGIPVLRAGFNEHLGWVTTNNSPDLTDVFALPIDPQHPDHYIFDGKSRPLIKRDITVEVKSADGKLRTVRRVYWESHLGKIIYRSADKAFAVNSTLIDAFRYYEGFYLLSKTKTLKEFLSVMRKNLVPTSNFTYADAAGNILYLWNARIPRRVNDGTDYGLDVPADTGKYVWRRLHKLDELPRLLNPAGGYIQNCNNPPWYTSLRDPIDANKYPPYLEQERELALRPQIALEMIEGKERFSMDDVKSLKYNTRMLLADRVRPDLLRALRDVPEPSPELQQGISVLEAWDGRVSAGSKGAILFMKFWDTYSAAVQQPFRIRWSLTQPGSTPAGIADPDAAVKHFKEAWRATRVQYGSAGVAYGEIHRFRFGSLDLPGDGASGTYGLFRVLRFGAEVEGKRLAGQTEKDASPVGFGDAWVIGVEFTKPIKAWSVLAYGQSSLSSSKHSSDQIRLFAEHELRPIWHLEPDIAAHLEREYHP